MRGAPHNGFSKHICLISARSSPLAAAQKFVRRRAEGGIDAPPLGVFQTFYPVDAVAADHVQDRRYAGRPGWTLIHSTGSRLALDPTAGLLERAPHSKPQKK